VLSIVALLAIIEGYWHVDPSKLFPNSDFICTHPNYSLIKAGQNHEMIKSIMGQADNRVVKESLNEYRFGQVDMESKILLAIYEAGNYNLLVIHSGNFMESGKSNIGIIVITIIITTIIVGGGIYLWQESNLRSVERSLQQQLSDNRGLIQSAENSSGVEKIETANWKIYKSDKYGFSFSYPKSFQIVEEDFWWYKIKLVDSSAVEQPMMLLGIDPEGAGPFFPDKGYELSENPAGKIVVNSVDYFDVDEYTLDGQLFVSASLEASNGHIYHWQFYFNEGGKDYEPVFKQILSTFKFEK